MSSNNELEMVWKHRRLEILKHLKERLPPAGHLYVLPKFDELSDSPLQDLGPQQQNEFMYNVVKKLCLDEISPAFYPFEDEKKCEKKGQKKIRFKVAAGTDADVKSNIKRLTGTLRKIFETRQFISQILVKKSDLGLVVRSVALILRDFMQNDFPQLVEKIFPNVNGSLHKVDIDSTNLEADFTILSNVSRAIIEHGLVGGQLISFLDSPDYHHPTLPNRSFIPALFHRCIQAGMHHYNTFLQEFLYSGTLTKDRYHEFMIWDLHKSNMFKAQNFYPKIDFSSDVPFDERFVLIRDLIPSIWLTPELKKMVPTVHKTRKLISILVAETRKPFTLPDITLTDFSPEKQFEVIKQANEIAGNALLEKINTEFNIHEFYNLLYEMIFSPSATWLADFVQEVAEISLSLEIDDSDADEFNRRFMFYFHQHCQKVKDDFDLVKIRLYSNALFGKCLPLDTRFVDFVLIDGETEDDTDTEGDNDENQAPNKNVIEAPAQLEDPKHSVVDESYELHIIDRIGIQFQDKILFKCLVSPSLQEHLNRLFRLRFALVRTNILLLEKRYLTDSIPENTSEQIFVSFVQNFISRYTSYVFGHLTDHHWKIFKDSTPKFQSIDGITESQRYLLRNINTYAGLYDNSHHFSHHLSNVLNLINDYCCAELTFNDVADQFYDSYKSMRAIVCLKEHPYLNEMSYEVFRVPPLIRLSQIEQYEIDPRKGLAPLPNLVASSANIRRSISLMNVHRKG